MADDVQYIKLPDGSYGKFASNAKDEDIQTAISKDFPNAFKPSEAEQVANRPSVPRASLPGALNPSFGKLPANLAMLPRNTRTGMPMGEFQPSEDAQRQASEENINNLGNVAKTGGNLPGSLRKQTALRTIGDISGVAEGVFSPTSIGIAAANTNPWTGVPVDAALVGHGLFNAATNAPSAIQGNPDAVQKSLYGLSEAAGGGAGLASSSIAPTMRSAARKVLLDPVTGEPTVTPTSVAKRVLRTPEEAGQIQADQLESKINDYQTARQKELADMEQLKEQDAQSRMNRGREQNTLDAVYRREGKAVPLSQSPYAPQHAAAADFAAGKPGPFNLVSSSPNIANEAFKPEVQSNPFGNNASSSLNPTFNAPLPKVSSAISPRMETVERFGALTPKRGTILDPSNIPPDEVTYQSTPWNELRARAVSGDKYAVDEVIRRGREAEVPGLASAVSKTTKPYPRVGRQ